MQCRMNCAAALVAVAATLVMTGSAQAYTVGFGCSVNNRSIGATAVYSANGSTQWYVSRIDYGYSNSGGGKTDTAFSVFNGSNATVWAWHTPDDRKNQSYTKSVGVGVSRGNYARAAQTTWFDVFGNDPSCSKSGRF